MAAMKEFISTQNTLSPQLNVCLTKRHFDVALEKVKPSISAKVVPQVVSVLQAKVV